MLGRLLAAWLMGDRTSPKSKSRSRPKRRRGSFRPGVEALEGRDLMATLVALTSTDRLLTFDSATPWQIQRSVPVSGLSVGESLASIDARPASGALYGVSNRNLVYTLSAATGVATRVGSGPAAVAQVGGAIGIDFNPNVDRLRLVTGANQNLRFNPATGEVIDADPIAPGTQGDINLAFAIGDPNQQFDPTIVEAAYDRNFQGTNLTTLFGIDSNRNVLVRIGGVDGTPSPNAGQVFTVGSLGLNIGNRVGFDITSTGVAYAALTANNGGGPTRLAKINLASGAVAFAGFIGKGQTLIDGLTELPRTEIVYGVTASDRLVRFAASEPGRLISSVPLRGLLVGEDITGIDFRPASGELFGITNINRVLKIDPTTGQTVQPAAPVDASVFSAGQNVGIDFNPTVDRLRLTNGVNNNLRYNPLTFAPVDGDAVAAGVQPDASLSFIATDPNVGANPNVVASAYDRNDNDPATATTLYAIDSALNVLVRQGAVDGSAADVAGGGSPNGGLLTTLGSLGIDVTSNAGLDVSGVGAGGNGAALAALQVQGETVSRLYSVNLNPTTPNQPTGAATLVGAIAGGEVLTAMAIAPATVQFNTSLVTVNESLGLAWITLTRTGGSSSSESVLVSTFEGTARQGQDYTPLNNLVVTFAPGETRKAISIPIVKDNRSEGAESVFFVLGVPAANPAQLGALATTTLRIMG